MQHNLFDHINIDARNTHVPDGRSLDFESYCDQYERMIRDEGGIDLQVLGIGSDGHIAFNEPGSSLGSRTRLKTLTEETVRDNARFFGGEEAVPRLAITMGVGTILESRQCLLLACGSTKARDPRNDRRPGHGPGHGLGPAVAPGCDRGARPRIRPVARTARLLPADGRKRKPGYKWGTVRSPFQPRSLSPTSRPCIAWSAARSAARAYLSGTSRTPRERPTESSSRAIA